MEIGPQEDTRQGGPPRTSSPSVGRSRRPARPPPTFEDLSLPGLRLAVGRGGR